MRKPPTERVIACGVTESGKDYLLKRLFLNRCPRSLVLDMVGEFTTERPPGGRLYFARSLEELRAQLKRAAREGPRWRVVAAIGPEQARDVARLLVPPVLERDGGAFPLYVGGMALQCSELDLFAPTNAHADVAGLWRRGRHVGLSVFGASQRPHGIARIVTAMSGWVLVTKTQEPADLKYLSDFLPSSAMREVEALRWRWAVLVDKRRGAWYLLNDAQKIVRSGATAPLEGAGERVSV